MIRDELATDKDGLALVAQAVQDLTLRFTLGGLSILGEAVEVCEMKSIQTLCTDGRSIYYSPDWFRKLLDRDPIYACYDMLHEWLHIFLNHPARRGDRDGKLWNKACDIVVVAQCTDILTRATGRPVPPPEDGVQPPQWAENMTAEEVYAKLEADKELAKSICPEEGGEHQLGSDFMYGQAQAKSIAEEDTFYTKFTEELHQAQAIMQQFQQTKTPSDFVRDRLRELTSEVVPWSRLLRGSLLSAFGDDVASYARPNRRYYPQLLMPTMRSYKEKILIVGLDVSASVGKLLLNQFVSNLAPAAARAEKTVIITFDAEVREEIHTRRPAEVLNRLELKTGAHCCTSTLGVFEAVDRLRPSATTILTDGWVHLPDRPYKDTLWVLPENGRDLPWGRNFHMRISW